VGIRTAINWVPRDRQRQAGGAAAGLGAARATHQSQGAARPLADHDLHGRFALRSHHRSAVHRGADQRRNLPSLHREGSGPAPTARRHRHHGQSRLAQGPRRASRHPCRRRPALSICRNTRPISTRSGSSSPAQHWLRKAAQRTSEAVYDAIAPILDTVSPAECANYFANAPNTTKLKFIPTEDSAGQHYLSLINYRPTDPTRMCGGIGSVPVGAFFPGRIYGDEHGNDTRPEARLREKHEAGGR